MTSRSHEIMLSTLYIMRPMHLRPWRCYAQQLLSRCIYMKIQYLTLTLGQGHTECCPATSTSYDLCTCKVWSCYVQRFGRICINKKIHYLTFDLGVKVTQNVAHYPLHHVTYAATKLEVATSNSLGGDAFTRKYIIWPLTLTLGHGLRNSCLVPSTSCDLCNCKVWICYVI